MLTHILNFFARKIKDKATAFYYYNILKRITEGKYHLLNSIPIIFISHYPSFVINLFFTPISRKNKRWTSKCGNPHLTSFIMANASPQGLHWRAFWFLAGAFCINYHGAINTVPGRVSDCSRNCLKPNYRQAIPTFCRLKCSPLMKSLLKRRVLNYSQSAVLKRAICRISSMAVRGRQ